MQSEDLHIKKIENNIRSIKLGGKKPSEVGGDANIHFNKLKLLNIGMYEELMEKYKDIVKEFNNKK